MVPIKQSGWLNNTRVLWHVHRNKLNFVGQSVLGTKILPADICFDHDSVKILPSEKYAL